MQIVKTIRSFGPAFKGLKSGFLSENNFRVHLLAATGAIVLGLILQVQRGDWLWLLTAICMVFTIEYVNTAIEKLTDLVSPQYNDLAGKVKDISAAAVLLISIMAAIIGLMVFLPYILPYARA